jgi:DNA-binding MarR family transcriptional regulator
MDDGYDCKKYFGRYISIISRNLFYYISKEMNDIGIGKIDFEVLVLLYDREGICQEGIVSILKLDKMTVAKSIKKLTEMEYIIKVKDREDKRKSSIYLTNKGLKIKEKICCVKKEINDIFLKDFNDTEIELFTKLLYKISKNAVDEISETKC